ncbi:hypothetical protein PIB30_034616 [Stylosanthes scabra]|uniref:Uncharacterized protein n=1 Tax=Stylosanthes scabra TaxID=79078 RepID=A0ABU6XBN3_9FABA|nr:hypothetical protein [Stylosanthes scabra]
MKTTRRCSWLWDDVRREKEWEATNATSGAALEMATTTWGWSGGDCDEFCLRRGQQGRRSTDGALGERLGLVWGVRVLVKEGDCYGPS